MRDRLAVGIAGLAVVLLSGSCFLPAAKVRAGSRPEARGQELFATKGCVHCHGAGGVGGTIGPDLQLVRKRLDAPMMFRQIHDGGKAMPSFGDQLSDDEINDVVAYLRAKRKLVAVPPRAVVPPAPKPAGDDPE